ncbi:MAG: hypothetical protein IKJ63_10505 [Clostridia bacterium]|nr:hypothetical protein [Clostridia bacterium]MBR2413579.1 hypothetical protein [Clostridia bacterium]MBR3955889.1 hypothetical protein [Clostridia bacterium]
MTCSFFGSRKYTFELFYFVRRAAKKLIEENGVDTFYICQQGTLDRTAVAVVEHLRYTYPALNLKYALPDGKGEKELQECTRIAELEYNKDMPSARAIAKRYLGMLQSMDFVIAACVNEDAVAPIVTMAEKYNTRILLVDDKEN